MSFHFAAARCATRSPIARALARRSAAQAANDNPASDTYSTNETQDILLKGALRQFAEHGLGAAREARKQAERAFFTGDRQAYDWWLGVCRMLDKRVAIEVEKQRTAPVEQPALRP